MKHYMASVMVLPFVTKNSSKSVSQKYDMVLFLHVRNVG